MICTVFSVCPSGSPCSFPRARVCWRPGACASAAVGRSCAYVWHDFRVQTVKICQRMLLGVGCGSALGLGALSGAGVGAEPAGGWRPRAVSVAALSSGPSPASSEGNAGPLVGGGGQIIHQPTSGIPENPKIFLKKTGNFLGRCFGDD